MSEKCVLPCNQHITILLSLLVIISGFMGYNAYAVIDNRNKVIDEEKDMRADLTNARVVAGTQHQEMMKDIIDRINSNNQAVISKLTDNNQVIIQRLSRLEAKIEAMK